MKTLIIDARKANDAGIGRYIQQLVPLVLQRLGCQPVKIWFSPGAEEWIASLKRTYNENIEYELIKFRPLSFKEQFFYRSHLNKQSVFWATSLSHPLFFKGKMIATVHDVAQLALPKSLAGGLFTKIASRLLFFSIRRSADEFLFVSEFSKNEFIRYVGKLPENSTITPLGVNKEWSMQDSLLSKSITQPYFISVSSVRPHKNFRFLLRAFMGIVHSIPHQLIIVGESKGVRTVDSGFESEIHELGDKVKFLGRIPDAQLIELISNAEAMIFPSLYEGFGLPPIEAMAAGCPVLSSNAGALVEVCGDAAKYFDPKENSSLQNCILKLISQPCQIRDEMIAKGRLRASVYNWDHTAELTSTAIRSLLDR